MDLWIRAGPCGTAYFEEKDPEGWAADRAIVWLLLCSRSASRHIAEYVLFSV